MGTVVFLLLFILGLILSTVGGIIGIVESFRVSTLWGLLFLFVPFAALVFYIKFWGRKWTRNAFLLSLGGLAAMLLAVPFGLVGFVRQLANLDEEVQVENVPLDEVPIEQQPLPEGTLPEAGEEAPAEEFAEPLVPAAPQLGAIAAAELIQSTDPDERVQQVNASRTDPFAAVPIPPAPQPPPPVPGAATAPGTPVAGPTPASVPAPPNAPNLPIATQPGGGGGATAGGGGGGATAGGGGGGATASGGGGGTATAQAGGGGGGATAGGGGGQGQIGLPPISALPQLPEPTLAQAVNVTGIIAIDGEDYAIVEAPTDGTSRYVKVGQRVANGQVLVKRIETKGSEPVVVLEQNGIEVSRPIGAPAEAPAQDNNASAARHATRFYS
jgi:hypothetical protein